MDFFNLATEAAEADEAVTAVAGAAAAAAAGATDAEAATAEATEAEGMTEGGEATTAEAEAAGPESDCNWEYCRATRRMVLFQRFLIELSVLKEKATTEARPQISSKQEIIMKARAVRPSRQDFGNFTPATSESFMSVNDDRIFFSCPLVFLDRRIQMIVPPRRNTQT